MRDATPKPDASVSPRYERRDVDALTLVLLTILLIIGCTLAELTVGGLLSVLHRRAEASPSSRIENPAVPQFPEPRLEIPPKEDLRALRVREDALLRGYGWVDRQAGVVHIQIERAMDLIVQRGLPASGTSETGAELQQKRPQQNSPQPETSPP